MGQSPQELRHDIERTREGMDATLDQIEDRISPSRIVERRKERMRDALDGARERVMGTAQHVRAEGQATVDRVGSRLEDVGGEVSERMEHLQEEGKRQYQGNPLAAGVIALGAGALLGSLLPQTKPEQDVAQDLRERLEPVAAELRGAGQEVADRLKDEAQQRVEEIKDTASEAAEAVKGDARESAEHLRDESRHRAEEVRDQAQR
jgi:gas vesicle protein